DVPCAEPVFLRGNLGISVLEAFEPRPALFDFLKQLISAFAEFEGTTDHESACSNTGVVVPGIDNVGGARHQTLDETLGCVGDGWGVGQGCRMATHLSTSSTQCHASDCYEQCGGISLPMYERFYHMSRRFSFLGLKIDFVSLSVTCQSKRTDIHNPRGYRLFGLFDTPVSLSVSPGPLVSISRM